MKKENILNDLSLYIGTLNLIDTKSALLEHAETDYQHQKKQFHKVTHQFKGINLLIYWIIFAGISLIPLSLLNSMIDTTFNFIFLVPFVASIALLLYINKSKNTVQKKQIAGMKKGLENSENKLKELIGEINYSKSLAEQMLNRLYISKQDYDLTECSDNVVNLNTLNFVYECINRDIARTFEEGIKHFELTLEETKKDESKKEIIEDYNNESLRAEFRKGVLKRCTKEHKEEPAKTN